MNVKGEAQRLRFMVSSFWFVVLASSVDKMLENIKTVHRLRRLRREEKLETRNQKPKTLNLYSYYANIPICY